MSSNAKPLDNLFIINSLDRLRKPGASGTSNG